MKRTGLALFVLLAASPALADRREVFIEVEGGLGVQFLTDAATMTKSGTGLGVGAQLHVFYGLTNSLHVGGYARGFYAPDVSFLGVTPTLADGSKPTGTLYENAFGAGGGALVRWRFDTGFSLAPFVQLELGVAWARFEKLQLIPVGKDFGIDLPLVDELAPDGRVLVGLEYRLGERFLLSLHLGGRRSLNRVSQWQLDVALAAGVIL